MSDRSRRSSFSINAFLPQSQAEANFYYYGLPSKPTLVARSTSHPWQLPKGSGAWPKKQTRPVKDHALSTVWERQVAPMIVERLNRMEVLWNSLDITHIGVVGEDFFPIILWIGVKPGSLIGGRASRAVSESLGILRDRGITDVEVEIRETYVTRSAGPPLLAPLCNELDPTADIHRRISYTLGFEISPKSKPGVSSSAGFFMSNGSDTLLVISRHGAGLQGNAKFEHKINDRPRNIIILSNNAYYDCIALLRERIKDREERSRACAAKLASYEEDYANRRRREKVQRYKEKLDEEKATLTAFRPEFEENWAEANRILGHIIYSPPIRLNAGPNHNTEDYAIVKLDNDKINGANIANIIDLSPEIGRLTTIMYPDGDYPENVDIVEGLMTLRGTISDDDMKSLMVVLKSGSASNLTFGQASGIKSFIRDYGDQLNGIAGGVSQEWAIHSYDGKALGKRRCLQVYSRQ